MADRSVIVRLQAAVAEYKRDMGDAATATKGVGTAAESATKQGAKGFADLRTWVDQNEQSLNDLTTRAGLLGAGLTAAAALAVKKFADFDSAMSAVAATGDDARASQDALRQAALDAGAATVFSATESADAITEMAKAGVSASDILGGGLRGALDLAAAGSLDVADAAGIASTVMNQFGLAGEDVGHIADVLAASAGKANGEVADFGLAMKYVGPVAAQLGVSLEETSGTLALLAQNGLLADSAGTGLRGVMMSLTAPTAAAQRTLDEYGITAFDAQGKFVGLASLAGQLHDRLGDLTEAERSAALGRIFGNEQITTARILYQQGAQEVQKWTAAVDDSGYAGEVAATKLDNLKGDLEALGGAFETAMINLGEGADGPLRSLVQTATSAIDAISQMSPVAQTATLAIVGGGGLALLGIAGLGKLTVAAVETVGALQKIGLMSEASTARLGALATSAGRLVGYAAGITAVAAGVGMMVDELTRGEAVPKANALADALYRMSRDTDIDNLAAQFSNFGTFLGMATVDVEGLGDALAQSFHPSVTDRVASFFDNIPGVTGYMEKLEDRFTGLDGALSSMVQDGHLDQARAAFEVIRGAAEAQGISLEELRTKFPEYVDALVGAKSAMDDTSSAQGEMRVSTENTTFAVEDQAEALATLVEAQAKLAGIVLSERDAQRNLEAAYDAVTESIETNGTTLDITTEKGRANQAALDDIARAGWDLIESMQANGAESSTLQATMQTTRDRFIEVAGQFGITGDAASALADQMGLIPKNVDTVATFTDNASAQVQAFVNRWAGKTVTVRAIMEANPNLTQAQAADSARYTAQALAAAGRQARGSVLDFFKDGAENHVAQIAPAGAWRVWAEPETGGEGYVPLAPSKRQRSEQIMGSIADRFGGQYIPAGSRRYDRGSLDSELVGAGVRGYDKGRYVAPTASMPVSTAAVSVSAPSVSVAPSSIGDVYVQNPFTGEYVRAQVAQIANGEAVRVVKNASGRSRS